MRYRPGEPRNNPKPARRSSLALVAVERQQPAIGPHWPLLPAERRRVVIEQVQPEIDAGRFSVKRTVGESVAVEADIFADGHDILSAVIKFRHADESHWSESPMKQGPNDRWGGSFNVSQPGFYIYTIEGWVNPFRSWQRDLEKKMAAEMDVSSELQAGLALIEQAGQRADGRYGQQFRAILESFAEQSPLPLRAKAAKALNPALADLVDKYSDRLHRVRYDRELQVLVDPVLARCGAWYELFPRSCAPEPGRHGTLADCAAWLPRIASMGFDVVYLPPIHPIGRSFRKGKNNSVSATPADPGSPWAIGSEEGGHKSIHPKLGTLDDFRALVRQAREHKLAIALDIAFQCSPDHPYVREHPEWFRHRPDGSIQYAENPPKKYQDIYPLDFETTDWRALWSELKSIFEFWMQQGVRVFRVDNPHTKPFRFWEWCLGELKRGEPELVFLSEAFTRPKVMRYLAKLGFSQSYDYFPWRNSKHELTAYFTELKQAGLRDYFRPNLWTNTPDILTQYLQYGGRQAFIIRFVLAATLGASYGIYGPPFEFCENQPREPGSEEYLNSEKYEIRYWDLNAAGTLQDLIAKVNQVRRENPALQSNEHLEFHEIDNEQLLAYSRHTADLEDIILVVVSLDPHHVQRGWIRLPLDLWGLAGGGTFQVHELLTNERFLWSGTRNYIELNPEFAPAHVFRLRRHVRTEQDFDYFL
ncbi:MAG TPA: alpha-1,4-glucan--maltose-1-phosphate maltosyltransferase [Verrucomicrobiae bacterium]|nr:alpha-1,4-glucan--maltose-1-phosphate maltosyltransferase [Verrucomicrobiae bacterium]